jgi:hypothetical protein
VTYQPTAGTSSATDLTIVDSTPASPRTIALTGSSLPVAHTSNTSLAFGSRRTVDGPSTEQLVTVSNTGVVPLDVTGVGASDPSFAISSDSCTTPVAVGGSCTVGVTFDPTDPGAVGATVDVVTDGGTVHVPVSGEGVQAAIDAPLAVSFGDVGAGASLVHTILISNAGTSPLHLTGFALSGPEAGDFKAAGAASNLCVISATVAVGGVCQVPVTFSPGALGDRSAILTMNADDATQSVELSGVGVDRTAPVLLSRSPAANASAVARTANVSLTFSEPVQGVRGLTLTLTKRSTGTQVRATVRRITTSRWVLDPAASLGARAGYTVRVVGGATAVRDLHGVPFRTQAWSFRTR